MKAETHLDVMLNNLGDGSLEERFIRAKKTFLLEKLGNLQEELERKGVAQDLRFLIMMLYIFDFIEREVGVKYAAEILDSLKHSDWPFEYFKPLLRKDNLGKKIEVGVDLNYRKLDPTTKEKTVELVHKLWRDLRLSGNFSEDISRIIEDKKKKYRALSSEIEKLRREIVTYLTSVNAKKTEIKLFNIGIVPTELCPNSCRFCLAAWKTRTSERISRLLSDEDFKQLADQIIDYANEKKVVITITGGEPLLELDRVLYIISKADTRVDLSTSGFWGGDKEEATMILSKIERAIKNNRNTDFRFYLQISLDYFHQEVRLENGELRENIPLSNIINIIELCQTKFTDIRICPITKYTIYEDPLAYLIKELKSRGWKVELYEKKYDLRFQVPVIVDDKLVRKPALLMAKLRVGKGKPLLISYSAVERIGKAEALEKFEYPTFESDAEKFLEGEASGKFPITGIEVSDDGNVYPGAHSLYSWSLGNLLETDLKNILEIAEHDPLIIYLQSNPRRIVEFALEYDPKIVDKAKSSSSPMAAVFKILETPEARLSITRMIIEKDQEYGRKIKKEIKNMKTKTSFN
jgi:MoaA/NifB/PqqE/SkfB family radical SAM enzyme